MEFIYWVPSSSETVETVEPKLFQMLDSSEGRSLVEEDMATRDPTASVSPRLSDTVRKPF